MPKELRPEHTMLICKNKDGREVGRIPAAAPNASAYMQELASHYGELKIEYEEDRNAGLLALLHSPR